MSVGIFQKSSEHNSSTWDFKFWNSSLAKKKNRKAVCEQDLIRRNTHIIWFSFCVTRCKGKSRSFQIVVGNNLILPYYPPTLNISSVQGFLFTDFVTCLTIIHSHFQCLRTNIKWRKFIKLWINEKCVNVQKFKVSIFVIIMFFT